MASTTRSRFWGPLFPDVWGAAGSTFWGPLFPDPGPELDLVTPIGPAGVATFVLDLDATLTVTHEWQTDIFKGYDGKETRSAVIDLPRRRFDGSALLVGGVSVRDIRTKLVRHAASGATFLLGLPYEGLLLSADAVGSTLSVAAGQLASRDWANPGQRVVIVSKDRQARNAVVQSASGGNIELDITPGSIGAEGGVVMPTVPLFLEPQQGFARYCNPDGFERWSIKGTAALFGFQKSPVAGWLDIEQTYPATCGNLVGVILQAREPGIAGNDIRVAFDNDSLSGVDIQETGDELTVRFIPGVTTVGELTAAINAGSALVKCIGGWNASAICGDGPPGSDTFAFTFLDGGSDGDYATDGTGAVVAAHASRPVFDRHIVLDGQTAPESLQAMNEIVELGGVPANLGQAAAPDWGRHVAVLAKQGPEWQWFKRFLATVRGRQRAFWLPTHRRDLVALATGVNTLTIDDTAGEFFTWYPSRSDIQIVQADGTITRATINAADNNGDGTVTLTIGVTLGGSAIEMVSWLELCHFEDDALAVQFFGHMLSMSTTARAVVQ